VGSALGLLCLLAGSAETGATIREREMRAAGLDPQVLAGVPSIRLQGLGDLDLAVADEANEINANDFGGNVAGLLGDGEGWTVESWLGNHVREASSATDDAQRRFGHSGLHVVRRWPNRALGLQADYAHFDNNERARGWSTIRGPVLSGVFNYRVGPAVAGLRLGRETEDEDRINPDYFSISHEQGRWVGELGVAARAVGVEWGAAWAFQRGAVRGVSVDAARFHEDDFLWTRPLDRYTLYALLRPGERLEGGLRLRTMNREGSERVATSWSAEFPMQGSKADYEGSAVTFYEEESDWDLTTRWRLRTAGDGLLAAEAAVRGWEHRVEEGTNFKGSERAGHDEDRTFSLGAGASRRVLGGRFLVGLEGRGSFDDWKDDSAEGQGRRLSLGAGCEFFAGDRLVLRGGASLLADDRDVDLPATLRTGRAISGGASWVPAGGLMQIHLAMRHFRLAPESDAATGLEEIDETRYTLGARWLP
jgi:hypothetical protein